MCVIIMKPMGVDLPDVETFRACWETNPDGFGMAYSDGTTVTIDKGHMDISTAYKAMLTTTKEQACIYHFRIATSGVVDAGACHPYPLVVDNDKLRQLKLTGLPYALAHNGIVGQGYGVLNDTQVMVKKLGAKILEAAFNGQRFDIGKFLKQKAKRTSSRFALLDGSGYYQLYGDWTEQKGLFFSNLHWTWCVDRRHVRAQDEESYYAMIESGLAPVCPVCRCVNTVAHLESALALCECYDCQTVFDGITGNVYEYKKDEVLLCV